MRLGGRIACAAMVLAAVIGATVGCSAGSAPVPDTTAAAAVTAPSAAASSGARSGGCSATTALASGQTTTTTLQVGGLTRSALVHVPQGYAPTTQTPLILAFHGHGGTAQGIESFSGLDASDSIVVYPQGTEVDGEAGWQGAPYASGADDVAFVSALLDSVQGGLCVDPDRVSVAGISNGGGFAALLTCALPDRFAALAVVAGAVYGPTDPSCPSVAPVPTVEFHGTADPIIAFDGGVSHGVSYLSVATWLDQQVQRDGCGPDPTATPIGADVTHRVWSGCLRGSVLEAYDIAGGGHTWPGATVRSGPGTTTTTISATSIIEAFFAAHPKVIE